MALNLPSGHKAEFSMESGEPIDLEGFHIKLSPLEHMTQIEKNKGFLEITPQNGFILMDYGWRTGEIPMSQLYREIKIIDGAGNSCKAKMNEVFQKDPRDSDEVVFLHETNDKLMKFLQKKCPKLGLWD
jgi:hypothetical protein